MEVEIEDGDFHHVGVVVEAGEGMLFEELPLRRLELPAVHEASLEISGLGVLPENMGESRDEETRRAAGWIADALPRLRVHERDHEVDDVARGAELAICAGGRQLTQQILVHVALEVVAIVGGQVHAMDGLDDRAQRGAVVNLKRGAAEEELAGVG